MIKKCEFCGKTFDALREYRKYCSACQQVKSRIRSREWIRKKSKEKILEINLEENKKIYLLIPGGFKSKKIGMKEILKEVNKNGRTKKIS